MRGCRQSHGVFVVLQHIQTVIGCFLCVVRAYPDTFAAVYTPGGMDYRMTVPDPNGFGGTALEAGRASLTLAHIQ